MVHEFQKKEKAKRQDQFTEVYDSLKPILEASADEQKQLSKDHIGTFVNTILRRKRFKISVMEMFVALFCNTCCTKRQSRRYHLIGKAK